MGPMTPPSGKQKLENKQETILYGCQSVHTECKINSQSHL